jgi:phosphoglycolate phosphatase
MIHSLLPEPTSDEVEQVTQAYKDYFYHHCNVDTTLYPGVVETLKALRDRGIKTAVASAKMTFMARRVCQVLGLDPLLDHVQGTDDFPGKPDPTVIYTACQALEVSPSHSVFVGDTVMDVQAAKKAGCLAVAVTYGIGKRGDLEREKPDRVINAFSDVQAAFGKL